MLTQSITYNTIITQVKNWIKTNCINISNYNSLPTCFKAGYTVTSQFAGTNNAIMTYRVTISKYISAATTANVDNDMNSFINKISLANKLNNNIASSELISFVNDLMSFCSTKVAFTVSQYSKNKYLIYNTTNNNYKSTEGILTADLLKMIETSDVLSILNILETVINQTSRTIPCTYSYNIY